MPLVTFQIDETPDGVVRVNVQMPACICTRRENAMIEAIMTGYLNESKRAFEGQSKAEDNSFTIKIGKG